MHPLRLALAGLLLLAVPAGSQRTVQAQESGESSLGSWLDRFASRIETLPAGPRQGLTITLTAGRGVEERRVNRVVGPHLAARLERGAVVGALVPGAPHRLDVTISLEADRVWAVGMLTGGDLPAPLAVASEWPVDRELEALLGLRPPRTGQGRWSMERLGTLPAGALDMVLLDLDGDGGDDLVVLGVDGVRSYLWSPLEGKPVLSSGPVALPAASWDRVVHGWLARDEGGVRLATTAGHALSMRTSDGSLRPATRGAVPLKQPRDPSRAPVLLGSRAPGSVDLQVSEVPGPRLVRDVARWPGRDDVWLWVDAAGVLGGQGTAGEASFPERVVGDRIVLAELDGEAGPELVTSEASAPGAPDRVRIHAITPGLDALPVLFEGELGGAVVSIAAGDLDFDGFGDLLLIEDTGATPVLWIVRRRS